MWKITDSESNILEQFKERLCDLDLKDNYLLRDAQLIRWLRAREMDIARAESMLRNHLKWREEVGIVECMKRSVPESMKAEFPVELCGYDKQGNVLGYIPYGKMDLKKGMQKFGKDMSYTMRNYYMEKVFQDVLATSPPDEMRRLSILLDFKGLSYSQFASVEVLELLISTVKLFEQNYPELLGVAFCINTPAVWSILWGMLRPLMHPKTQQKVVITGSNLEKITEILQQYISDESIPEKYGGIGKLTYPEPTIINDINDNDEPHQISIVEVSNNKSFIGSMFGSLVN